MDRYNLIVKQHIEEDTFYKFQNSITINREVTDATKKKRAESRKKNSKYSSKKSAENSQKRAKGKILGLAKANKWEWSICFTMNPQKVDRLDYEEVSKKFSNWLDNVKRNHAPNMKYIIVPELDSGGGVHFHGLLSNVENLDIEPAKIKQNKHGTHNVLKYRLGWSYATKINNSLKAALYISKYITKDLYQMSKNKKKFWSSRNLEQPKIERFFVNSKTFDQFIESQSKDIEWKGYALIGDVSYENEVYMYSILKKYDSLEKVLPYLIKVTPNRKKQE